MATVQITIQNSPLEKLNGEWNVREKNKETQAVIEFLQSDLDNSRSIGIGYPVRDVFVDYESYFNREIKSQNLPTDTEEVYYGDGFIWESNGGTTMNFELYLQRGGIRWEVDEEDIDD